MPLIPFLLTLIVVVCLVYCVRLLLPMLGLPEPVNKVVLVVLALVALLMLLNSVGVIGGGPYLRLHGG
jgi:hypothetical protein